MAEIKEKPKAVKKASEIVKMYPPKKSPRAKLFHFEYGGKHYSLTLKQKLFSEAFCSLNLNGIDAVVKAMYNVFGKRGGLNRELASSIARENLHKPNICAYITVLFDKYGFNDDNVDKQLLFVINQHADLGAKIRGIDIYNKQKGKYAPEKIEHTLGEKVEEALDRLSKILP